MGVSPQRALSHLRSLIWDVTVRTRARPAFIVGRKKILIKNLALILLLALCGGFVPALGETPVEIELWHYFDSSNDKDMIEERVETYNRLQDRIHITATYVSRQELMNQYTIGAISGQLPDIGMVFDCFFFFK